MELWRNVVLQHNLVNSEVWIDYKDLLDKEDPIDKLILELAGKGELKVGAVVVKGERWHFLKKYMPNFLFNRGKHTP